MYSHTLNNLEKLLYCYSGRVLCRLHLPTPLLHPFLSGCKLLCIFSEYQKEVSGDGRCGWRSHPVSS